MPLRLNFNYNSKISEALFNDSPISIFILNNDGKVVNANQSAINLLNITNIEIKSKTICMIYI